MVRRKSHRTVRSEPKKPTVPDIARSEAAGLVRQWSEQSRKKRKAVLEAKPMSPEETADLNRRLDNAIGAEKRKRYLEKLDSGEIFLVESRTLGGTYVIFPDGFLSAAEVSKLKTQLPGRTFASNSAFIEIIAKVREKAIRRSN